MRCVPTQPLLTSEYLLVNNKNSYFSYNFLFMVMCGGQEMSCSLFRTCSFWFDMGNGLSKGVSPTLNNEEWQGEDSCTLVRDGEG